MMMSNYTKMCILSKQDNETAHITNHFQQRPCVMVVKM